jgi:hypothetical protein
LQPNSVLSVVSAAAMSVVSAAWGGSQATPAGTEFVAFRFDDARAIATVKVADLPDAGQIRQGCLPSHSPGPSRSRGAKPAQGIGQPVYFNG